MLLRKKVHQSENHLGQPFGNLFLKVADFQFTYVKEMLEKKYIRRDNLSH